MAISDDDPSPPDPAMREGMEGLIAAMKAPRPRPAVDPALESTVAAAHGSGDALAAAPWDAVDVQALGSDEPPSLERGVVIGRFVVIDELGAGGMGVVYAAYDPELDRKVALKLLRPGAAGSRARERFLREAQALAKLNHPNVVAIHDVGTRGRQVWLAMELVQGQTLRAWLKTPRGWPEVVRAMLSAGEGLAAAHAAGLLHRDFKPDNVMLGDDGRMRVMDFGLALGRRTPTLDERENAPADAAMVVTKATTLAGTPGYMAPEQFVSTELTAAADQYSFCMTLWEALYGERPYPGDAARWRQAAKGRRVPGWLRRICKRGLAAEPEQRWPSMAALLDALAGGRTRTRLRNGLVAVGVLAAMGASGEGLRRLDVARQVAACEATGSEIETAWNEERRRMLRDALLATGVSYAAVTAEKTIPWLDRQAVAWSEARVEACLDARVRDRWSEDLLERSLWCLGERHTELGSLVDELTEADPEVVPKAVPAASGLSSMAPCRDVRALEASTPPPAESREEARAVRAIVTHAGNLELSGRHAKGLELARRALARAEVLGWRPLVASARLRLGSLESAMGAYADAEASLEAAYFEAANGVDPEVLASTATRLVNVVGVKSGRHTDGRHWMRLAEVAITDAPVARELYRAFLFVGLAGLEQSAGAYERAARLLEQALAVLEAVYGADHPSVANVLGQLATVHQAMGAVDQAEAEGDRALRITRAALGDTHPQVAEGLSALGAARFSAGRYDDAKRLFGEALAIYENALGPDHPEVGDAVANLGHIYRATGEYEEAKALYQRALAINEAKLDPKHPSVASKLDNLATIQEVLGAHDEAHAAYQRALAIREEALGPDHPRVASTLIGLASTHLSRGAPELAKPMLERALAIWEKSLGPEHPNVAGVLANLANACWDLGQHEASERFDERGLAIREKALGPDHPDVATSLDGLARARYRRGALDEAKALFERALAIEERTFGADHADLANSLAGLGEIALAQHRPADAVPLAERAVAILERGHPTVERAEAQLRLARALWDAPKDAGRDRTRAQTLAEQARDTLRTLGSRGAAPLAEVERWLAEHAAPRAHP